MLAPLSRSHACSPFTVACLLPFHGRMLAPFSRSHACSPRHGASPCVARVTAPLLRGGTVLRCGSRADRAPAPLASAAMTRVALLGGGKMGAAFVSGLLDGGFDASD